MTLDWETGVLFAVIGVMVGNQLVMRVSALRGRRLFFWTLQAINLGTGTAVVAFGLPGFDSYRVVSWIVGMLFFFRVVQNNNLRAAWIRASRDQERVAENRRTMEAALLAGGGDTDMPPQDRSGGPD